MIKLIVADMDGTLLSRDGSICNRNIEALKYAKEKGVKFAIVTGRDYHGVKEIFNRYPIDISFTISGNGAQFSDGEGSILSTAYLNKDLYIPITNIFEKYDIPFMVFTTDGFYANDPIKVRDAFIERSRRRFNTTIEDYMPGGKRSNVPCMKLQPVGDKKNFIKKPFEIIKVEAFSPDLSLLKKAKEELSLLQGISYLSSFDDNIEVTDEKAQKGKILANSIDKLGIKSEEVIVVGDGLNDSSLFELFKYSFAPSNGDEIIKEMAYEIVCSNNEGAVADAIYKLI